MLSGVFLGLLFHTRPLTCGAICLSYGLYMVYTFATAKPRKPLAARYFLLLAAFLVVFALIFLYNYSLTGHPLKSPYQAGAARVFKAFDWARGAKSLLDNFTLASLFLMVLFGWSGCLTNVFLFGSFLPRAGTLKRLLLPLSSVVFVFAAYMLYSISSVTVMYGPRYVFEITFLQVLLVVHGGHGFTVLLWRSATRFAEKYSSPASLETRILSPLLRLAIQGTLILFLLFMAATSFHSWRLESDRPWPGNAFVPQNLHDLKGFNYTSPVVQKRAKRQCVTNAVIFVQGPRYQCWHYGSVFPENSPDFDSDIVYAKDLGPSVNQKVTAQYPGRRYYMANYDKKTFWEVDENLRTVKAPDAQGPARPSPASRSQ